jgi:nucleotide-binding universal stress UspA family protein
VEDEATAEYAATGKNFVAQHEEDLLLTLLRKTTDPKLFPLTIAAVHAEGTIENRQFAITRWNRGQGKNHIILHTDSELYAVLLYRSDEEEAKEVLHQLREHLEKQEIRVSIVFRYLEANDLNQDLIELYDKMKKRLREEC